MTSFVVNGRFLTQPVTGVQKVARELLYAFDRCIAESRPNGLEVEVLAPPADQLIDPPRLANIHIRPCGGLGGHSWEQIELPKYSAGRPLLCLGNTAPVASLANPRQPVVTMVHDLSYRYFPHAYSRSFRLLYRVLIPAVLARSDMVITVSQSERRSILHNHPRLVDEQRLIALQNGGGEGAAEAEIDDATAEGLKTGSKTLAGRTQRRGNGLYVGSLSRRKNAQGVLTTAIGLARDLDLEFRFVGSTDANFEALDLDVPDEVRSRIVFLGQVNQRDIVEAEYRQADFLLFPSFYEASPLPPVEAMRLGCPVIAGDIPSLRERCGDAALYVEPAKLDLIERGARRLLDDDSIWSSLQRAGLRQAAEFSWDRQATSIVETMRGLV